MRAESRFFANRIRCGNFRRGERLPRGRAERSTQKSTTKKDKSPGLQRNPDEWKTGDEPMTAAQRSYLHTLATEANEDAPEELTKAEAAKRIEQLQKKTGRRPRKHKT